ncbi:MAG: hypothetical protein V4565_05040 [Bacteroidota bacterium]
MTINMRCFILSTISFLLFQSCNPITNKEENQTSVAPDYESNKKETISSIDTKGYNETGLYKKFDCPDDLAFAPIDLMHWATTPVVNNRLATYEETKSGLAIHHYQGYPGVRPFYLKLPKLAYTYSPSKRKTELVVVIQIVQTAEDTIVGYRYLSGGCGGSLYRDFHFLTDDEIQKVVH